MALLSLIAGCSGDRADRSEKRASLGSHQFEVEGVAVEVSNGAGVKPALPGVDPVGSIKLRLISSNSPARECSLEPPREVIILFTATTRFAPVAAIDGTFPKGLDGNVLNIKGKLFDMERSCTPVAEDVTDQDAREPAAPPNEKRPRARPVIESSPDPTSGGSSEAGRRSEAAAAPTTEQPNLPPLAPEVKTTFRPSLPDPPIP